MLGWEHRFSAKFKLLMEAYYKDLDDLIPYYIEQLKLEYGDENSLDGYAKGFDIQLQGEIVEGIKSWISYSYLDTQEKEKSGDAIPRRRILDQTHTLRFFLQDKMPNYPNIQAHTRILFGSGYLYHPRKVVTDPETGERVMVVDYDYTEKYQYYARVDAGFSVRIKTASRFEYMIKGEVLNMFNHTNVASYSWLPIYESSNRPTRIDELYPGRFFNVGIEMQF